MLGPEGSEVMPSRKSEWDEGALIGNKRSQSHSEERRSRTETEDEGEALVPETGLKL